MNYFSNLNINNYTDNKKFWKTVKPLFSKYDGRSPQITLIENDNTIPKHEEVAMTFNKFFKSVESLDLTENKALLNATEDLIDPIKIVL